VLARGGAYLTTLPGSDGEQLASLVVQGKVRPVLSRTLTLDEVPAALEAMRLASGPEGQRRPRPEGLRFLGTP